MSANNLNEEAVFKAVLQIGSSAERSAYLDKVCGDNAELRSAVEALLASHEQIAGFLETPPVNGEVAPLTTPLTESPGTLIGRYKLLEQIGEGGMGVVYMAEQTEPVRRKVALKIIKIGMDTKQVIARFEAERQALALMDHTNIARVLDGGATETGRPYFVMDLVRGMPITEYCDKYHLSAQDRLDLFLQLCDAVQHAHQKGIIHRDIKPTNVMVTLHDGKPVPKIIDFGIAKATNQRLTEKTLFTNYAQMIGTPEYMSPEQAELSGLDVDTRTDIYSLGALLYELLTGITPFGAKELHTAAYAEIQRIIREEEPVKPSTRVSTLGADAQKIASCRHTDPASLHKLCRGDLDWIVMKTLEKDRTRRYETASGFAEDIRRYLHDEPVVACPPSAGYRFRKFARRNRAALTATALVAGVLLLGTAISTCLAVWATKAERLAEERLVLEQQAADAAVQAQKVAEEAQQRAERERDRAEKNFVRAQAALEEFLPKVRGEQLQPRALLTSALRLAKLLEDPEILRELIDKDPKETRHRATQAALLHAIGLIQTALQKYEEAEDSLKQARELSRALLAEQPDNARFAADAAAIGAARGDLYWKMGRLPEARSAWLQSCSLVEKALSWDSNTERTRDRFARTQRAVCSRFGEIGLWQEASAYPRTNAKHKRITDNLDVRFAATLFMVGPDAIYREFRRLYAARREADPAHVVSMEWMGADAALTKDRILDLGRRGTKPHSPTKWRFLRYAFACYRAGRFEQALEEMRRAGFSGDWRSSPNPPLALVAVYLHALAHHALDHEAQAGEHFNKGEALYRQLLLKCLDTKGLKLAPPYQKDWWHLAEGQILRAEAWREIRGAKRAPDPWGHLLQARAYAKLGDTKKAELHFQAAVDVDPEDPGVWISRARLFAKLGDPKRAKADWRKSIGLAGKDLTELLAGGSAYDWFFLAMAHKTMGHQEEARTWYDKAVEWARRNDSLDVQLRRVCAEASKLLGVADPFQSICEATRQPLAVPELPTGKLAFVNLAPWANKRLDEGLFKGMPDNHLGELPQGRQTFAGVEFEIGEAMVQLTTWKSALLTSLRYARDIPVGRKVARLYVLHGTHISPPDGREIGSYIVHYEDGTALIIPIVHGKDVRSMWDFDRSKPVNRAVVGWQGRNPQSRRTGHKLRLYVGMWKNAYPDKQVKHIDYVLAPGRDNHPFCVAMTVEEPAASAKRTGQTTKPATPATKPGQKKPAPKDRQ